MLRGKASLHEGHGFSRAVKGLRTTALAAEVRFSTRTGQSPCASGSRAPRCRAYKACLPRNDSIQTNLELHRVETTKIRTYAVSHLSPAKLQGAEKTKFDHLDKTKDLALSTYSRPPMKTSFPTLARGYRRKTPSSPAWTAETPLTAHRALMAHTFPRKVLGRVRNATQTRAHTLPPKRTFAVKQVPRTLLVTFGG
jgi:hypothetical protein